MSKTITLFYLFDNREKEIEFISKHPDPEEQLLDYQDVFDFLDQLELSPSESIVKKILQNS